MPLYGQQSKYSARVRELKGAGCLKEAAQLANQHLDIGIIISDCHRGVQEIGLQFW